VTPAPTGPTFTPTSSAIAGVARAPTAAAINKYFFISFLLRVELGINVMGSAAFQRDTHKNASDFLARCNLEDRGKVN
jgi:hypothetical protein